MTVTVHWVDPNRGSNIPTIVSVFGATAKEATDGAKRIAKGYPPEVHGTRITEAVQTVVASWKVNIYLIPGPMGDVGKWPILRRS